MRVLSIFPPYSNTKAPTPKCISPKNFQVIPIKDGKNTQKQSKIT